MADSCFQGKAFMAGAGGIEPPHGGIKIHCLTAWLRPIARAKVRTITCRGLFGKGKNKRKAALLRHRGLLPPAFARVAMTRES